MNHLIAKLRIAGGGSKFRKILSSDTIYSLPNDLENHVTYRSDHNLDEDSWFGIENFSSKDYCISLLDDTFNSADFDALENINAEKIDYICIIFVLIRITMNFIFREYQKLNWSIEKY